MNTSRYGLAALCMKRKDAFAKFPVRAATPTLEKPGDVALTCAACVRDLRLCKPAIEEVLND